MSVSSNLIPMADDRSLLSSNSFQSPTIDAVFGIAIFDLNGLPTSYFKTEEMPSMNWIQTAFQTLGLRLLFASITPDVFYYAVVQGVNCCVLIVQQKQDYVAFLLPFTQGVSIEWIKWAQTADYARLSQVKRFQLT